MADTESARLAAASPYARLPVPPHWTGVGGEREYPAVRLEALVERQAVRTPDTVAVRDRAGTVSYAGLVRRARHVARRLRTMGAGPGDVVVLYVGRSIEQVVGVLGVLMAGAAYSPIDPGTPVQRRQRLLDDLQPSVILVDDRSVSALSKREHDIALVMRRFDTDELSEVADDSEDERGAPSDAAYVIYTSGSTGFPKGVVNQHDGVSNHIAWMNETFPLAPGDIVLGKTPAVFDVSVWEWFWTLSQGASLVLAEPGAERDPAYLVEQIESHGVTDMQAVPTLLRVLLDRPDLARCRSLRRVFCSGEALSADLRDAFFSRMPGPPALVNLYGPTEAAVHVTGWVCSPDEQGPVPIGRPSSNVRAYIVDEALNPVGVGVEGELLIGGIQVARGYLHRDDLTRERFIADPFTVTAPARCYRTGDRAAWRPDGAIDYLGRLDSQVQLGGVRVELGEIEAALRTHAEIADAAVLVRPDARSRRLVAYLRRARSANPEPTVNTIRIHLAGILPEYMIPGSYVWVNEFPTTSSGKLDRAALPEPPLDRPPMEDAFEPPHTGTEERMAALWRDELQLDRIGRHDDFSLLGGDSLSAVRLIEAIHEAFGVELPLSDLVVAPTLRLLAHRIDSFTGEDRLADPSVVMLREGEPGPALFLPPSTGGDLRHWRDLVEALPAGPAVYGFALPRDSRTTRDLPALATAFIRELVAFQPDGPYHLAGYSFSAAVAFEMAHQLRASGRQVGVLAMIDYGPGDDTIGRFRTCRLFLQNLPQWLRYDILESGPRAIAGRVRRKIASLASRMFARQEFDASRRAELVANEMYGDRMLPAARRQMIVDHLAGLFAYEPQAYGGDVLLFLARCRPLFHSLAPDLGWGRIARGGFRRVVIGCNHDNIVNAPHVGSVARILADAISRAG